MRGKLGLAGLIVFVAAVSFVLCSAWDWRSLVATQPKPVKNVGAKLIPHTLTGIANCMECHQSGIGGRAPRVTHKLWSQDCLACHSTAAMLAGTPAPPAADRRQWAKNPQPPARQKGEYVILSWNDVGMKCVSDNDKHFGLHYPSQVLWAQVFRRGDPPTLVTSGVELRYVAPEGRRNPAATLDFWNYVKVMHKKDIPVNVGMAGLSADQGKFTFNPEYNAYIARGIPVSPYDDSGKPDPYPLFSLQLTDLATVRYWPKQKSTHRSVRKTVVTVVMAELRTGVLVLAMKPAKTSWQSMIKRTIPNCLRMPKLGNRPFAKVVTPLQILGQKEIRNG